MADSEAPVAAAAEPEPAEEAAAAPSGPILNEQGFPVAAELLEEVMAAEASGAKGTSKKDMGAEMAAERSEESGSNVLIYFEQETKAKILERIVGCRPPDGLLFLGGAETVLGISDLF